MSLKYSYIQNIILFMSKFSLSLCLFTLLSFTAFSDADWHIAVDGLVTKENKRLEGAIITLVNMEEYPSVNRSIITPNNGKFIFILNPGEEYMILASKTGLVTKKIMFSTKNIPEDRVSRKFPVFPIEISLFEEAEGLDVSILEQPVGKIIYNDKKNDFEVDRKYAKSIRRQVLMLQKELLAIRKNGSRENRTEIVARKTPPITNHQPVRTKLYAGGSPITDHQLNIPMPGQDHVTVTEVVSMDGNKKIIRRIVMQKNRAIEYKMVAHPWGGIFFFKNGRSIAKHIFDIETNK